MPFAAVFQATNVKPDLVNPLALEATVIVEPKLLAPPPVGADPPSLPLPSYVSVFELPVHFA